MHNITLTTSAAAKISELLADEEDKNTRLRVYVVGGGCSGFQYGFTFDEETTDEDILLTVESVPLTVDWTSMAYLDGATVDYTEDLSGSQFKIINPNATTTCGCGSSFSID